MNNHGIWRALWIVLTRSGLVVVGFAIGSALAEPQSTRSLFEAMLHLHHLGKVNAVFASAPEKRGMDLPVAGTRDAVQNTARTFNRDAVPVQGVYVLLPKLWEAGSATSRIDSLRQWQDKAGGPERWRGFSKDSRKVAQALGEELGPGSKDYNSLSPAQRRAVQECFDRIRLSGQVKSLNYLLYGHTYQAM